MEKQAAAGVLREIAVLLELKGENPFKSRAYENAARSIETHEGDVAALARAGRLGELPGVGEAIQAKLTELFATGHLGYHEQLRASFPPGIFQLLDVPGLGPRKLRALHDALGIDSLYALDKACRDGRVAALPGFGPASQSRLLDGVRRRKQAAGLFRSGEIFGLAQTLRTDLLERPDVLQVELAGDFRRGCETVSELVLVAAAQDPDPVLDSFVALGGASPSTRQPGSVRVSLPDGPACELHVVPNREFSHRLLWLTGNTAHIDALRERGRIRGLELSESGLGPSSGDLECFPTEQDTYRALGLAFIPPELRECRGEIEAAEAGTLPRLLEWTDLRGTFHCHTTASDGRDSLEQMAEAARELGMEYFGIADHSKTSAQARGLDEARLLAQVAEIRRLNARWDDFHLLAGTEVDILKDGTLDFSDDVLAQLDYAVASVHSHFNLDEAAMTQRLIRAAENPHVTILGHLTGRLLLDRPGFAVDVPKIIDACAATGTWIELNANAKRLDMDWRWWRLARDKGVLAVINPDAHARQQLGYLRFGVTAARKGWLRSRDVANTRPWRELRALLALKRPGARPR